MKKKKKAGRPFKKPKMIKEGSVTFPEETPKAKKMFEAYYHSPHRVISRIAREQEEPVQTLRGYSSKYKWAIRVKERDKLTAPLIKRLTPEQLSASKKQLVEALINTQRLYIREVQGAKVLDVPLKSIYDYREAIMLTQLLSGEPTSITHVRTEIIFRYQAFIIELVKKYIPDVDNQKIFAKELEDGLKELQEAMDPEAEGQDNR